MKEPIIYYQQHTDKKYLDATAKSYADLRKYDEVANGMFGGDESLHGNNPTQGSELCTAVEMMFTLENTLRLQVRRPMRIIWKKSLSTLYPPR